MAQTFLPPALLKDFDRSPERVKLYAGWHQDMDRLAGSGAASFPAAFSAIDPPAGIKPKLTSPEWTGLPRTIKRIVGPSIAAAAKLVDEARAVGDLDPVDMRSYEPFLDSAGNPFHGPLYRSQDEYLEWALRRDDDGIVTELVFTCEGPEYWERIATDEKLLVALYQEICEDGTIKLADLVFDRDLTWRNPYSRGSVERFAKGTYNRYNRLNAAHAVHLTHPANTLSAEITLALEATLPYGKPDLVTNDPDLVCCAAYGGINRMSDPTIGSGVNTQVIQLKRRVALRNPIGLYIKGIQPNVFTLADGTPFTEQEGCWTVLRPDPKDVTDMIVRARFRVPDGVKINGKQLRVGDLFLHGEQVVTGGQIADIITLTLYALAIPGAPEQNAIACIAAPCRDKIHPDFIHPIAFGEKCSEGGISPQMAGVLVTREKEGQPQLNGALPPDAEDTISRYSRWPNFIS